MIGIELQVEATPYLQKLQDRGVLALSAGTHVVRLLPPLVITQAQLDFVLETMMSVLQE